MLTNPPHINSPPVDVAICIDGIFYQRYRAVLRHLCVGLIDEVSRVRLVSSTAEAEALTLGPIQTVTYEPLRWPMAEQRFRRIVDRLGQAPPTVIHAMSAGAYAVAERLAAEFDADLVYQITATEDVTTLGGAAYTGTQQVICASTPLANHVSQHTSTPAEDIALVRPGVICATEPTCFRNPSRAPTILATASFDDSGHVEDLLHAVSRLRKKNHEFLTFLLGTGPDERSLRQLANQLGVASTVVFAEPAGDVLQAMVGADVFVQPGVEESISARSLQALAQGMAIVGRAGGVHDAYVPDQTAVVVKGSTPTDLAAGIERLMMDHTFARQIASQALEHMRAHHTMSAMADLTAKVYRKMGVRRATIPLQPSRPATP